MNHILQHRYYTSVQDATGHFHNHVLHRVIDGPIIHDGKYYFKVESRDGEIRYVHQPDIHVYDTIESPKAYMLFEMEKQCK